MALVDQFDLEITANYANTASLNGNVNEEVYKKQPKGVKYGFATFFFLT